MHESMVKFLLMVVALLSLALGGVFLFIPGRFVELSQAEAVNVAWLRTVGASLVTAQGFGLFIAAFRRRDTNPLLAIVALKSTAESAVLWYSLVTGEFSAQAVWAIVVPAITATAASIVLWAAWLSRRRSLAGWQASRATGGRGGAPDADAAAEAGATTNEPGPESAPDDASQVD